MTKEDILKQAKPILFNTEMVQAIIEGRKTVTRRVVKRKYSNTELRLKTDKYGTRLVEIQKDEEGVTYGTKSDGTKWLKMKGYIEPKPPYKKWDVLYVRETWQYAYELDGNDQIIEETGRYYYAANESPFSNWVMPDGTHRDVMPWRPSIHMPKEAARIFLLVNDVRVERLKDITVEECIKEGIWDDYKTYSEKYHDDLVKMAYPTAFSELWNETIKKADIEKYGWDANPWVWVIEFEKLQIREGSRND